MFLLRKTSLLFIVGIMCAFVRVQVCECVRFGTRASHQRVYNYVGSKCAYVYECVQLPF